MRNDVQPSSSRNLTSLNTAVTDIMLAACQRTFALNAAMLDEMLVQGARASEQAAAEPAGNTMQRWPNALPRPATAEQLWRYSASWLTICQWATASIANLLTAQSHGADDEVATITKEAHDQVNEAAASAAAAAESVMSTGIAAVGRITEMATQAAASVGAPTQAQDANEAAANGSRARAIQRHTAREH